MLRIPNSWSATAVFQIVIYDMLARQPTNQGSVSHEPEKINSLTSDQVYGLGSIECLFL